MRNILITGAGGFIGQALATSLLSSEKSQDFALTLTDIVEPRNPDPRRTDVRTIKADIAAPGACDKLLSPPPDVVFLLHGIMSSGAEANLELGQRVNLDSIRILLDHLRAINSQARVVFSSSIAVYGPPRSGQIIDEYNFVPYPSSSYGCEKLMVETLLNDYSRRGLVDGCIVRLPTVVVRPGVPTAAASSFASGIVREPLKGIKSILPVGQDLEMWICSPKTVVSNLIHAMDVPSSAFGLSRTVNLPGITVSVAQMLSALEQAAGKEVRSLVEEQHDPKIEAIVRSWPAALDTTKAKDLGFHNDVTIEETVRIYMEENPAPKQANGNGVNGVNGTNGVDGVNGVNGIKGVNGASLLKDQTTATTVPGVA